MKKGPEHTAEDALKVFRTIAAHFENNPELLKTDGVFRISANSKNPPEIIKRILKKKSISDKGYSPHDLIGALKESLKNNVLLDHTNPSIKPLIEAFAEVNPDNKESLQQVVEVINELIENLAASSKEHNQAVAEVLHTYLHLTHLAASYATENRMTPNNLAVAAIGPLFYNNIMITNDPMEMMSLTSKATPVAEEAIQSNRYDFSFQDRHRAKTEVDSQHIIDQLEQNLRVLAEQREHGLITQVVYDKMVNAIGQDVQKRKEEISRFVPSASPSPTSSLSGSPSGSPRSSSSTSPGSSPSSSPNSSPRSSPPKLDDMPHSTRRSVRFLGDDGIPKVPKASSKGGNLLRSVSSKFVKKPKGEKGIDIEDRISKKPRGPGS